MGKKLPKIEVHPSREKPPEHGNNRHALANDKRHRSEDRPVAHDVYTREGAEKERKLAHASVKLQSNH